MTRPLIGITTDIGAAAWGDRIREVALSPAVYTRAIERAGGAPVLLPPLLAGPAGRLVDELDGLMFCGGAAIGARWCGPAGPADCGRDAFEIALLRAAVAAQVPFLAISRGLQVLNVALGGTLVSPPASSGAASGASAAVQPAGRQVRLSAGEGWLAGCAVRINPDSRLGRVLGATAAVSASPHQAPDRLGHGLTAVAWSGDGTVAAVEVAGHPFGIGVRWHPEEGDDLRIFTGFRVAAEGSRRPATAGAS